MEDNEQYEAALNAVGADDVLLAPLSAHGDEQLDIHKPKPVHSWREFLNEIGVIVIGVLIALAGEQLVETIHWADRVHDSEASMIKELGEDDGAQAHARIAFSGCIGAMLDATERGLVAERDRAVAFHSPVLSPPPFRTWDNDAWLAAVSSGATSHMTTEGMYQWSSPYALISDMDQAAVREYNDWAPLMRIQSARVHPSDGERERLLSAIANARRDNELLTSLASKFVDYARLAGVTTPDKERRRELSQAMVIMPACKVGGR